MPKQLAHHKKNVGRMLPPIQMSKIGSGGGGGESKVKTTPVQKKKNN